MKLMYLGLAEAPDHIKLSLGYSLGLPRSRGRDSVFQINVRWVGKMYLRSDGRLRLGLTPHLTRLIPYHRVNVLLLDIASSLQVQKRTSS